MSAKDLLAVLVMVVPGVLLIALIALTLVPVSVMQPFPGSGLAPGEKRKAPERRPDMEKARSVVLVRNEPGRATQKKMRDPWARESYAKVR